MKIAMVSEHASPLAKLGSVDAGGQNVHVGCLALALGKLGNDVTVYTRRDDPLLPQRVVIGPNVVVEHVEAGPARYVPKDEVFPYIDAFAAHLERAWSTDPPDVVHGHFWMSGKAAVAAAKPLGVPVVQTFHALGTEKRRVHGAADPSPRTRIDEEAAIVRAAARIVATSSAEVFELLRMGANPRSLKIIPCGVDLDAFRADGPADERDTSLFRVVTLGRLVPRKGIADVIEALAHLEGMELVIGGGGDSDTLRTDPDAKRLVAQARAHGVADRVTLRGRVERDAVAPFLRSADVVVCTPWYEPFGIVALEAMACGVPLVVSAVGGLIDTVVDGMTGVHVLPRQPRQIAYALDALRADPAKRARFGRLGVERTVRYAWSRIAAETLEVYRNVAEPTVTLRSNRG